GLIQQARGETDSDWQVALAHEVLAGHWPRLMEWLSEARDQQRRRLRLTSVAEQWEDTHDPSVLWGASLLDDAERYTDLSKSELEFIRQSRAAIEQLEREKEAAHQREMKLMRYRLLVLAVLLFVVVGLAVMTYWFYRKSENALAKVKV